MNYNITDIASAVSSAIHTCKLLIAKYPEGYYFGGGFSLEIVYLEKSDCFYAEVEFCTDSNKTIWIEDGTNDELIQKLWDQDEQSILDIVDNYDQDWIKSVNY